MGASGAERGLFHRLERRDPGALRRFASFVSRLVMLAAVGAIPAGCGSLEGTWAGDRLADLTDVANLRVSAVGFGLYGNVGPLVVGARSSASGALSFGPSVRGSRVLAIGAGGPTHAAVTGTTAGLLVPLDFAQRHDAPRGGYALEEPPWGAVGVELAIGLGLGVRFDVVELADFLVGFFGPDLGSDDLRPLSTAPEDEKRADSGSGDFGAESLGPSSVGARGGGT